MIFLIIAGIIVFVMYKFFTDRDKMLSKQLEPYGGIENKYRDLISYFLSVEPSKIVAMRRDYIGISCLGGLMYWGIQETFNEVVIDFKGNSLPSKRWEFHHNTPQEIIIAEIDLYFAGLKKVIKMKG